MFHRCAFVIALASAGLPAAAQHAGDFIFGAMGGQATIVEPTTMLTSPPVKRLTYRSATDSRPADFVGDQGFDYWFLPDPEITEMREARIVALYVTPGLVIRDAFQTYFALGASRPTFLLRGSARHKHFSIGTTNVSRPTDYVFRFKLTEAFDVDGVALADSPVYTVTYRAMPPALDASGAVTVTGASRPYTESGDGHGGFAPVPEPGTWALCAGALALIRRRRRA